MILWLKPGLFWENFGIFLSIQFIVTLNRRRQKEKQTMAIIILASNRQFENVKLP